MSWSPPRIEERQLFGGSLDDPTKPRTPDEILELHALVEAFDRIEAWIRGH